MPTRYRGKKEHYVWREVRKEIPGGVDGSKSYDYEQVVSHPMTTVVATAICALLETENPDQEFVVSASKPRTYVL